MNREELGRKRWNEHSSSATQGRTGMVQQSSPSLIRRRLNLLATFLRNAQPQIRKPRLKLKKGLGSAGFAVVP